MLLTVGQVVGHAVLAVGHPYAAAAPHATMLIAHLGAVLVGALLISAGEQLCRLLAASMSHRGPRADPDPTEPTQKADNRMHALHRGRHPLVHVLAAGATALALVLTALLSAGPAWAHAARIAADPTDNAALPQAPGRVSATFNETMQPEFAAMTVVGPDGVQWADGTPTVDGAVISIGVRPGGPAGTYTVNYRATSADGHVVTGSWPFQVTTGATAAATTSAATPTTAQAAPASPAPTGLPAWPFAVGVIAVVAAGAVWAVRRRS